MASVGPRFKRGSDATHDPAIVCISQLEYEGLVEIANRYASLRQNLLGGGVNEQTIDLLSSHSAPTQEASDIHTVPPAPPTAPINPVNHFNSGITGQKSSRHQPLAHHPRQQGSFQRYDQADLANGENDRLSDDIASSVDPAQGFQSDQVHSETVHTARQPTFERLATRSVQLMNLPEGTNHADITSIVRGGQLLDVYLRSRDRTAALSFLHSEDAEAFHEHVRKKDLYIRNKRVDIKWNERQYVLPGHVAQKKGSIRDDLEHIHNLVVIKVEFIGDSCFISTNSVANAMYARTCMMSRLKYKGSRIEWDVDECAQPLDRMPVRHARAPSLPPVNKKPMNPMANRFELLNLDD